MYNINKNIKNKVKIMAEFVKLKTSGLEKMREMDERLVSYNVEMTEVTGGTFWTAYTDAQVDGT